MNRKYRPWLKSLSGLYVNLSAGFFGLAFITPNFIDIGTGEGLLRLTKDIGFGILFLLLSGMIEEQIK